MGQVSCAAYRDVVRKDPRFIDYFQSATPVNELGRLNIGSRPAKRKVPAPPCPWRVRKCVRGHPYSRCLCPTGNYRTWAGGWQYLDKELPTPCPVKISLNFF